MKRLRLWLRELNLSQQLLTIVFMSVTFFALFFFVYLTELVDQFVEGEMYNSIHRTQDNIVANLEYDNWELQSDSTITSFLVHRESKSYVANNGNQETIPPVILNQAVQSKEGVRDFTFTVDDELVLYSTRVLDEDYCLVSVMSQQYQSEFRNALLNSVINMSSVVVGVLFVILMIWVGSLIHPLNLIRNYIEKVRKGEHIELRIDRRDEIGEVADALIMMREELTRQEQIKDEMIQNISHDLKTPIATIKSYGESIKDGIYPYETLEKSVDVIIEHANRLEKKVYSLLMLNKMGYLSDVAEEGDTLDMVEVIRKVMLSMEVLKEEVNITTILNPVCFHGEEEPWRIVVENLLENALRYAKSEIVITLNDNELEVSNDGPPLSKDRKEKLFKPYEKGTDGKFGLGLSIVYRVCTTYGYRVSAENLEEGVLFKITKNVVSPNKQKP